MYDAHIKINSGTINVTSAVKDGIHANNFKLFGGNVTVSGFGSDGIEAEYASLAHANEGTIKIMGGTLNVTVANDDGKGLKCDTLTISDGTINITILPESEWIPTYNNYGNGNDAMIDYIFYKNAEVLDFKTLNGDYGKPYISDHYPVMATMKI